MEHSHISATALVAGDIVVSKTDNISILMEITFEIGENTMCLFQNLP